MNMSSSISVKASSYDRAACKAGVVHLGFGAFHRAHQAVYLDDYMAATGDLDWGIIAVNLRGSEAAGFQAASEDIARHDGYFLKSYAADGAVELRRVRSHVGFVDWSRDAAKAEAVLAAASVHLVTITVTESGYYTDETGDLDLSDATIAAETSGGPAASVYGFLRAALSQRVAASGAPLTIACCDNIRQNGKMLHRNLLAYLRACGDAALADWTEANAAFPCSMVDRITPRSPESLGPEISTEVGATVTSPIMAEDFIQWVLQSDSAAKMPALDRVGVIVTPDVDPYEETKIRVLNGGHTALAYLAALEGIETFDAAMRVPHLLAHFRAYETEEVLPALTLDLPFSKAAYLDQITARFGNAAIGDTVARICADGMAKFPIFIRPTLAGCLSQGILPTYGIRAIASWYVFARHVDAGKISFTYIEPRWADLRAMLGSDSFITSRQLWGEIPQAYPQFAKALQHEIAEMESQWPV